MFAFGSKKSSKAKAKAKAKPAKKHSAISYVPRLIPLAIKLGFVYLRFKRQAKNEEHDRKDRIVKPAIEKYPEADVHADVSHSKWRVF